MKPKNGKTFFRLWLGRVHLGLGLASGLLVFLISISGATYAFRDELFDWFHRDAQILREVPGGSPLPPSTLLRAAQTRLGEDKRIQFFSTYADPHRTWEFRSYEGADSAITYFDEVRHDVIAYVNPYTGEIVEVLNHKIEFFQLVKMFHWSFLLANDIGQPIVGYAVLVFLLMLISGTILWWPRKLRQISAKLRIPWSAGWKSKAYALHSAWGMMALPVSIVIATTGLAYAFRIVMMLLYAAFNLSTAQPDFNTGKSLPPTTASRPFALDKIHADAWKRHPDANSIGYSVPDPTKDSATLNAYIRDQDGVYYRGSQEHFDRYSGKLLTSKSFSTANRGEKYVAMNYDIHVGAILGLPGKILAFCASLVSASLPITGFLIWRGRRRKKRPAADTQT